ncbi:hypothetical protein SAMN05443144_12029 [Fodinibius roseus]|uniref:Hook-length control protein FliK n=1 Tax=Fodinibius roseus TaxID=1194090 RepID=A0A1M5HFT8_9BACT|nr:hypothetical protein [Fodinibius roseus]SHG14824.1 hypothetical protein SAMN05443144_12029 [Fodinibius roseus]
MIGKIVSKSAHSEEAAVFKKDTGSRKGGAVPVFKSLMDTLQGDHISDGNSKSMAEGMLSEKEIESLANEGKDSEAVHIKAGNIHCLLSEGDPKSEEVIARLRELLKQVKQEGQGQAAGALIPPASAGEAAGGMEKKDRNAPLGTGLRELLTQHLSDEEAGRPEGAVESGQSGSVSAKIARVLSEGNVKEEETEARLRELLKQVRLEGQGQAAGALIPPASAGEAADGMEKKDRNAPLGTGLRELLTQHLSDEEAGRPEGAVESGQSGSVSAKIARILSEGNVKEEETEARLRELLKQVRLEGEGKSGSVSAKIARILSEGNMKDEEVKTHLRNLLNQLHQKEQGPEVQPPQAGEAAEQAQAEGKNTVEGEAPDRSAEHKTDLLFRGRSDDKETAVRDNSQGAFSDKASEDRSSGDRLEKNRAGNRGSNSERSAATGRNGRPEGSNQPKKITDTFFLNNPPGGASEKGLEMKGAQLRKSLQKEDRNSSEGGTGRSGGRIEGERRSLFGRSSPFAGAGRNNVATAGVSGTENSTDSIPPSTGEQELMWKEYSAESADMKDDKETGQSMVGSSSLKLGQVPIANAALRTKVLPALTRNAIAAASEARKTPEQWQKHNFVLDDGKKMQLSVREVQGVLQVKMGSMNLDLSKLLQQHLQQIREHLKQEFGAEIDLQLDHPDQEGPASHFSGRSPGRNGRDENPLRSGGGETRTDEAGKAKLKAVRSFGYNEMEWIA